MNRPFVALLAALFAGGVASAPVRALLPAYVESVLQQPPLFSSTLLAIQLGCGGLFALAGGAMSDLVSRRAAVLVGLTTALFGATLFAVHDQWLLVVLAVLWGIAGGFNSAGGQSFLMSAVSRARLGSASAVYFVAGTASGALGTYIAGLVANRLGFGMVAAGAAALGVVALLLAAIFLPPMGRDGSPDAQAGKPRGVAGWTFGSYADLLRQRDVVLICGLRFFPTVAWGIASFATPLLLFRISHSTETVGQYAMISLLAASGAQLATGRQVDRLVRRGRSGPAAPEAGAVGAAAVGTGLASSGSDAGSARTLVAPLVGVILVAAVASALLTGHVAGLVVAGTAWAMSAWALSTTMPPLIHELGRGIDDGRLVALTHLLWSAGMLTGTWVAGSLIDWHAAAPYVSAVICLAITFGLGVAFRRPSHRIQSVGTAPLTQPL